MARAKKNESTAREVKTLTIKELGFEFKPHSVEERQDLMRVVGIGLGTKAGNGTYGEYNKILGEFEATNMVSGEVVKSNQLILPGDTGDMAVLALTSGQAKMVEIAVEIAVIPSDRSARGYTFVSKNLMAKGAESGLAALKGRVAQNLLTDGAE